MDFNRIWSRGDDKDVWKVRTLKITISKEIISSPEELWKLRLQVIEYSVIILIRYRVWEYKISEVSILINKWKATEN